MSIIMEYMEEYGLDAKEALMMMVVDKLDAITKELSKMNSSEYADGLSQSIVEALKVLEFD